MTNFTHYRRHIGPINPTRTVLTPVEQTPKSENKKLLCYNYMGYFDNNCKLKRTQGKNDVDMNRGGLCTMLLYGVSAL